MVITGTKSPDVSTEAANKFLKKVKIKLKDKQALHAIRVENKQNLNK